MEKRLSETTVVLIILVLLASGLFFGTYMSKRDLQQQHQQLKTELNTPKVGAFDHNGEVFITVYHPKIRQNSWIEYWTTGSKLETPKKKLVYPSLKNADSGFLTTQLSDLRGCDNGKIFIGIKGKSGDNFIPVIIPKSFFALKSVTHPAPSNLVIIPDSHQPAPRKITPPNKPTKK